MNDYIVELTIVDTCCTKCFRDSSEKTISISDNSQVINLKNGYTLTVVSVSPTYCTVLIQNGVFAIVRNIFTTYDTQICLPAKCVEHVLTLSCRIIRV